MELSSAKLVTHKGCHDGMTAAVLFLVAGGKYENILFSGPNHTDMDDLVKDLYYTWEGPMLLVDVSVSSDVAELLSKRMDVLIFDHHKSAESLKSFNFATVDSSRCGSKIFFDWLMAEAYDVKGYKELVDLIDDRDRWVNQHPKSAKMAALSSLLGEDLFIDRFYQNPSVEFSKEEEYLILVDDFKKAAYIKQKKKETEILVVKHKEKYVRIGIVNAGRPDYISVLGEAIYSDLQMGVDVAIMVNGDYISMRTNKPYVDCSELCKLFGGGGHKSAGGCTLKGLSGMGIVQMVSDNLKNKLESLK